MKTILLLFVSALSVRPQSFDATSLNARYHFVQLAIVGSETGQPIQTQNLGGDIVFDGSGGYHLTAQCGSGTGTATAFESVGTYTAASSGIIALTNPAKAGLQLNARAGADGTVLIGSSTEAVDGTRDLFIAVRASTWSNGPAESHLTGNYAGASFLLPDGAINALTTAFIEIASDGAGGFSSVAATGQAANLNNLTVRQTISGARYTLLPDGTGSATFGDSAALFGGSRQIFVSPDGEILIGVSPDAGRREILVAVRRSVLASIADWKEAWWIGDLSADNDIAGAVRLASSLGALEPDGGGSVRIAQRLDSAQPWRDVTAINYAALNPDGTTQLGPFLEEARSNLAIGSTAFVSAEVGAAGSNHRVHGLLFGVRWYPGQPFEVQNAASFAPGAAPITSGELITLRGEGLSKNVAAGPDGAPANELNGVTVMINGTTSRLIAVAPDHVNLLTPNGLDGASAQIVASYSDMSSKAVTVPLASSSSGVFTPGGRGSGPGMVTHADGRAVTRDDPAAPGETITVFVTGWSTAVQLDRAQAYFGEYQATVLSADALPGAAGIYRVQTIVPIAAPIGDIVPVALGRAAGLTSMVDISIR